MDDELDPEAGEFFADAPGEPSERDVWAAANQLIKVRGQDAALFAAMRADNALAAGDVAQYRRPNGSCRPSTNCLPPHRVWAPAFTEPTCPQQLADAVSVS